MNQILSKELFSKRIEEKIRNNKETYIDAIINTCEEFRIEPDDCKKYLNGKIISKLQAESIRNKTLISDSSSGVLNF